MVRTVSGQPGRIPGSSDPASLAGQTGPRDPGRRAGHGARQRAVVLIRRRHLTPYLLLLPSAVAIGLLLVWPTIQVAERSFQNYGLPQVTGQAPIQWVGGANFSAILADPEFWLSLRISLIFAAVVVPLTLLTGTLVGLLLNRLGRKMSAFVSSAVMLAWATPAVSASVIFIWLADPDGGIVDWALTKLPSWLGGGAHWAGFSWTNAALPAYALLTVLVVWQGFPFVAVSVLAGLKTIPAELHESARVDGGGPWRIFWRITYPLLKPIFLVLLLSIIWDFGSDALEMRATRDMFGIPRAAVLAVAAGTDLLCLGRDGSESDYLAVREALVAAVRDGALDGARLEEAADRVARLRGGLARTRLADPAADGVVPGIGLAAARRAARLSGPRRTLSRPVIIEVEPRENIAAGRFGWGLGPWAAAGSVRRVSASGRSLNGAEPELADSAGILAAAAGRSLVVAVRDAHRDQQARSLVSALLTARPDLVLVEMGLPLWHPPEGTSYLATYGASRASARAAAELLGLA